GDGAAFVPGGAFGPDEEDLAGVRHGEARVLAVVALAGGGGRGLDELAVPQAEPDLPFGFPGEQDAVPAGEGIGGGHGAGFGGPGVEARALPVVFGDFEHEGLVALVPLVRAAVEDAEVAGAVGEGVEAAAGAGAVAGVFDAGFGGEGLAAIGGEGDEDAAVF